MKNTEEQRKEIKDIILSNIENLKDSSDSFNVPYSAMNNYEVVITDLGGTNWEIDTNGWQHDFWIDFTYEDINYRLVGSWYYGDSYSICLKD